MPFENDMLNDLFSTFVTACVALFLIKIWEVTAGRGIFDQILNRKLVHISVGLVFMLCWPLFSDRYYAPILACIVPGVNVVHMLLLGLGVLKDDATVNSMSRYSDHRELLKGPLYYASACTLACLVYWRSSPISVAIICNLCSGDGFADVVGRRVGVRRIPYNRNKTIAGSLAMAVAGFTSSIGFMLYFSCMGFLQGSWRMTFGFLCTSMAAAVVESLPVSTVIDDNLTIPTACVIVGGIVF